MQSNLHYGTGRRRMLASLSNMSIVNRTAEDRRFGRLMEAAQAGDAQAYKQLLDEIAPKIRRIVAGRWKFLGGDDAEDLVQEVLLSLHAVRSTYDPQRPFIPWLLAITRNRLADGARHYIRREAQEVHIEDWSVTFSAGGANSGSEAYIRIDALRHAIQQLPAGQRAAIEMLKIKGMSLKEAAAAGGMSIGSLKAATHRAMATLRKTLRDDE
jgi:RNA polymerase sigma factor (sigma-70 family)